MKHLIIPIFFLLCACQSFGIKDTDTIAQAEMKVLHGIESKAGIVSEQEAASK